MSATTQLKVTGMHCSSCSMLVTMNLEDLPGVASVSCDHASGNTSVVHDPAVTDVTALIAAIGEAGYDARLAD